MPGSLQLLLRNSACSADANALFVISPGQRTRERSELREPVTKAQTKAYFLQQAHSNPDRLGQLQELYAQARTYDS